MATEMQFPNKVTSRATANMYLNEETADVHFVFEIDDMEQRVAAHKSLLAAGSPVFHAMFYGTIKEKGDVKISDASVKGFMDFLSVFYLDQVKINKENVAEIMDLSNKYDIPEGMEMCEEFLMKHSTVGEMCTYFSLAIKYNLKRLQTFCEKKICTHAVDVLKSESFVSCSKDVLGRILKLENLNCSNMETVNACMAWAKKTCQKMNIDATDKKHLRSELGECFFLIPFVTMDMNDFMEVVFDNRELFIADEVIDIMAFIKNGISTELTKRFESHNNDSPISKRKKRDDAVNIFKWDHQNLMKYAYIKEFIGCMLPNVATTFAARKPVLFGGFRVGGFENKTVSGKSLLATVRITKEVGVNVELQEEIQRVVYADKKSTAPLEIKLKKPIVFLPGTKYKINIDFSANNINENGFVEGWLCSYSRVARGVESDTIVGNIELKSDFSYSILSELYFNQL